MESVKFLKLDNRAIEPPQRGTTKSACWDLFALEDVSFRPGEIKVVKTGWACEIPLGWRANIYVRSSTPLKKQFILANGVGVIDNDYRGDLGIQLLNVANITNFVHRGEKIAQIEFVRDYSPFIDIEYVNSLTDTERGAGGFGSTD